MTTADLQERLRYHYSDAEWTLMFEVLDSTGGRATRSADAVAMNTWPSRGMAIHGHEIKAHRSDWLRELKNPAKAEAVAQFCDYWWLVAHEAVVVPDEVPLAWGLMVPAKNRPGLRVVKKPQQLEAKPLTRGFVASMVRNVARADAAQIGKLLAEERAKDYERNRQQVESAVKRRTSEHRELQELVARFEEQSGIEIKRGWYGDPNLGKKVALISALNGENWNGVESLLKRMRDYADDLETALAAYRVPKDKAEKGEAA